MYGIGTRIFCLKQHDGNYDIINKYGTIKNNLYGDVYGIEFDTIVCGHDIDGFGKDEYCWYVSSSCFRLANPNKRIKSV